MLVKKEKYRVAKEGASLEMPHPINQIFNPKDYDVDLPVGATITYLGRTPGWGSDNVSYDTFEYEGKEGSFYPNFWGVAKKGYLNEMRIPSSKDERTAMEKLAARYVHIRFGVHQNVRDYPVPDRFRPWKEYFYMLLAREIRKEASPS
jgi:hypothetical protein